MTSCYALDNMSDTNQRCKCITHHKFGLIKSFSFFCWLAYSWCYYIPFPNVKRDFKKILVLPFKIQNFKHGFWKIRLFNLHNSGTALCSASRKRFLNSFLRLVMKLFVESLHTITFYVRFLCKILYEYNLLYKWRVSEVGTVVVLSHLGAF